MSNIPRTVTIRYGWAEGPWHAKRLVRELQARGFTVVGDAASADIIFAHSSGCYQIPKDAKAQVVLLVGLPYGSVYHLVWGLLRKEAIEFNHHRSKHELRWWGNKIMHNGWYLVTKPCVTYDLLTRHKTGNLPSSIGRRVFLVRPSDDAFMQPGVSVRLAERGYEFIEIDGSHDSCWVEPRPYVDLIAGQ